MGILECEGDELLAENLVEWRAAVASVLDNGLVDHVPALDAAFVAGHYGGDVVAHTFFEHIGAYRRACRVNCKPGGKLRVPDEGVAYDGHVVAGAVVHEGVGIVPEVDPFLGMYLFAFHAVFSYDRVEVAAHYRVGFRIESFDMVHVQGGSDEEVISEIVFQCGLLLWSAASYGHQCGHGEAQG